MENSPIFATLQGLIRNTTLRATLQMSEGCTGWHGCGIRDTLHKQRERPYSFVDEADMASFYPKGLSPPNLITSEDIEVREGCWANSFWAQCHPPSLMHEVALWTIFNLRNVLSRVLLWQETGRNEGQFKVLELA